MSRSSSNRIRTIVSPAARRERQQQKREKKHLQALEARKRRQEKQVEHLKKEVDVIIELTAQNVENVMNRGESLDALEGKADHLEECSDEFKKATVKIRRRMCCNNVKACVALIVAIVFLVAVLIGVGIFLWKKYETVTDPSAGSIANAVIPGSNTFITNIKVPKLADLVPNSLFPLATDIVPVAKAIVPVAKAIVPLAKDIVPLAKDLLPKHSV